MAGLEPSRITINPSSDAEFYAVVERLAQEVGGGRLLEQRLREAYPRAAVVATRLSDEPVATWYVYRDGRWSEGGTESIVTYGLSQVTDERRLDEGRTSGERTDVEGHGFRLRGWRSG